MSQTSNTPQQPHETEDGDILVVDGGHWLTTIDRTTSLKRCGKNPNLIIPLMTETPCPHDDFTDTVAMDADEHAAASACAVDPV